MSASRATPLGQLLMIGLHGSGWSSSMERRLEALQPGGVLLYPGALRRPGQTAELLFKIARTLSNPPFLAIAEEGGSVDPLRAFLPPLPAPRIVAQRGPTAVRRQAELIGAALKLLGFNLNFAPRLDLSNPDVKPPLDTQTFGADPKHVAKCGRAFIEGLRGQKILACGKHFPGRGAPEYDKNGLPMVGKTMAELWCEDLLPFRELLTSLPLIELSNVSYKAYDFDAPQPASVSSKVIHDLLRIKLGYRGLEVADLLELLFETSPERMAQQGLTMNLQVCLLSIKGGCDLQILNWGPKVAELVLPAIQNGLEGGSLTRERVAEALGRIRAAKKRLNRPSGKLRAHGFDRLAREFEKFAGEFRSREEKIA